MEEDWQSVVLRSIKYYGYEDTVKCFMKFLSLFVQFLNKSKPKINYELLPRNDLQFGP